VGDLSDGALASGGRHQRSALISAVERIINNFGRRCGKAGKQTAAGLRYRLNNAAAA